MRVVIVGAVALGASTAARLKRLNPNYEVILLEKGNYASFANCGLPYFVGDVIKKKDDLLVVGKEVFINRFQIDLRLHSEAIKIDPENNRIEVYDHEKHESYWLSYDNLVLAMGADATKPPIKGIDSKHVHYLKSVDDAIGLKDSLKDAKDVAVIGGGFIGLEAMENIAELGKQVTLIEARPSVSNLDSDMAKIVHKIIKNNGVNLLVNTSVNEIKDLSNGRVLLITSNGEYEVDEILMSVGIRPNTKLAVDGGITLDANRTIAVNDYLQTNYPNIYAGGDLVSNNEAILGNSVYVPLANYANKHGRIIANNIHFNNKEQRQKITMASVFKLFDYTIASVGLGDVMCQKFNVESRVLYNNAKAHAGYYPGATAIYSKIRFDNNGKILGAQFIGKNMVEKRVDALSALLLKGCTYKDLMQNESSYAPPFNAAKDVLNMFGFMIDNVLNGGLETISPMEIDEIKDIVFIVDVRSPSLYKLGHIPHAINIPLDELRDNLDKLPKDQKIYVHCTIGLTSYNAICVLRSYGYKCVNVSGGYSLYNLMCL